MASCIIFGAADFDGLIEPIGAEDYVIAADGGLAHTRKLGITPQAIIGDFDSLGYVPEGSTVFPVEKDDTDSMLAVKHALALGYRRFALYGAMDGKRLDHTVANFQTLGYLASHGGFGFLVGRDYIACAFRGGTLRFDAGMQGGFSLFCMGADAEGVTIRGLHYETDGVRLTADFPLGVSNHFTGCAAEISLLSGTLLALWQTQPGLPVWRR